MNHGLVSSKGRLFILGAFLSFVKIRLHPKINKSTALTKIIQIWYLWVLLACNKSFQSFIQTERNDQMSYISVLLIICLSAHTVCLCVRGEWLWREARREGLIFVWILSKSRLTIWFLTIDYPSSNTNINYNYKYDD